MLKFLLAVFLYYSRTLAVLSFARRAFASRNDYAILMYHRVLAADNEEIDYVQPGLYVAQATFDKQMEFLSRKCNLISMRKLAEQLKKNQKVDSKSVAITFDDGWEDNYRYAYPVLRRYNAPATIFLPTDYIDSDNRFWFAEIYRVLTRSQLSGQKLLAILEKTLNNEGKMQSFRQLISRGEESGPVDLDGLMNEIKQLSPETIMEIMRELENASGGPAENRQTLTWEEIDEMNRNGIEFGSHGCSHKIMIGLSESEIEREFTESKKIIEDKLSGSVALFAYPNGDYNESIKKLAAKCGYLGALATGGSRERRGGDIYSLKRINIHEDISTGPAGNFSAAMFSFHIFRNS